MSIEAMRQALEVLEQINQLSIGENAIALPGEIDAAMDNLRAAIEQAAEPVAWRWKEVKGEFVGSWVLTVIEPPPYVTESMPLYTAPRQWVGLTDEEIKEIIGPWGDTPIKGYTRKLFDQIEAKLRSKND